MELALTYAPAPQRVLEVGCGTGYVLRQLADCLPTATEFAGTDPAREMVAVATASAADERLHFLDGAAERRPFLDGAAERRPFHDDAFDLVISTTSFDHWTDQQKGLRGCAQIWRTGGIPRQPSLRPPVLVR